jgi:hypothetical protein
VEDVEMKVDAEQIGVEGHEKQDGIVIEEE